MPRTACLAPPVLTLLSTALACDDAGVVPDALGGDAAIGSHDAGDGGPMLDAATQAGPCDTLAEAAGWMPGTEVISTAEATPDQIRQAGEQTWDLSLRMLAATPEASWPDIAQSPASLYFAMGMAYARWQDAPCGERIHTVMKYPSEGEALHNTLGASIRTLEALRRPGDDYQGEIDVSLRQSVWEFHGDEPALEPSDALYGATRHTLKTRGPAARELVNCVIEEQSRGLLKDFLPIGEPRPDTTSYDINVAFLLAGWAFEMQDNELEFTPDGGEPALVEGIGARLADVKLFEHDDFRAIQVPFRDALLSLLIVTPSDAFEGDLSTLSVGLTSESLARARAEARGVLAELRMPKFAIASETIDYAKPLEFGCEEFTLRKVFHGATVEVDKNGLRAAAASVAEGWDDSGPPEPEMTLEVNRSFLFFVYDPTTRYVLYSGRYHG